MEMMDGRVIKEQKRVCMYVCVCAYYLYLEHFTEPNNKIIAIVAS